MGRIPEEQGHRRVAQSGGAKAERLLAGLAMAQQEIPGAIEVLEHQGVRCRPIDVGGQPRRIAGPRGPRASQAVDGHRQHGHVVRGRAAVVLPRRAPQRSDASLVPYGAGRLAPAIGLHRLHIVDADLRRDRASRQSDPRIVRHAQQALGQSAQGLRIDLVGTAARRNAPRLRAPPRLMVVMFRELVIESGGAVLASLASRAEIQT